MNMISSCLLDKITILLDDSSNTLVSHVKMMNNIILPL